MSRQAKPLTVASTSPVWSLGEQTGPGVPSSWPRANDATAQANDRVKKLVTALFYTWESKARKTEHHIQSTQLRSTWNLNPGLSACPFCCPVLPLCAQVLISEGTVGCRPGTSFVFALIKPVLAWPSY